MNGVQMRPTAVDPVTGATYVQVTPGKPGGMYGPGQGGMQQATALMPAGQIMQQVGPGGAMVAGLAPQQGQQDGQGQQILTTTGEFNGQTLMVQQPYILQQQPQQSITYSVNALPAQAVAVATSANGQPQQPAGGNWAMKQQAGYNSAPVQQAGPTMQFVQAGSDAAALSAAPSASSSTWLLAGGPQGQPSATYISLPSGTDAGTMQLHQLSGHMSPAYSGDLGQGTLSLDIPSLSHDTMQAQAAAAAAANAAMEAVQQGQLK